MAHHREPSHSRHPVDDMEPAGELDVDPALLEKIEPDIYKRAYRDASKRFMSVLENVLFHLKATCGNQVAFYGVAYGLGSVQCCDDAAERAVCRKNGWSPNTVSKDATSFRRNCGLPPNQGKDADAIAAYHDSRNNQLSSDE